MYYSVISRGTDRIILILIIFLLSLSIISSTVISLEGDMYSNNQKIKAMPLLSFSRTRAEPITIYPPEVTDDTVVYAIICPSNLTNTIKPLAEWKTQKGVPAKIYNTNGPNGIYSNFSMGDNATKIHDFLRSLHENNSNLQWVLIVGDEDIIPSRKIFVNASGLYGLDDYYYTDHYYAGLNNSWDQDNDGIYGEQKGDINWQADLFVGRLPVNNASETNLVIEKILKYERAPTLGTWMNNISLWSGLLDGPNNLGIYQAYKDNSIKVTNKIISHIPNTMNIKILYDYEQLNPGNYTMAKDILNHSSAKADFYGGNSIINFAGQAYYTGDELANYIDPTGMSVAPEGFGPLFSFNDAKYATNGEKLPLVYLSTCSINFSEKDDSNLEQLLTAENGGAIGLIGNTGKSYRGETENGSSYGNWWLNENFWKIFFNGSYQPGKCLYELKEKYALKVIYPGVPYIQMAVANLVGYNLLGDPEVSIWTDIPKELRFTYSIVQDSGYKLKIKVTDSNNDIIPDSLVCVYNSKNYEYQRTDDTGIALLDLDPRGIGELNIIVTAHNHFPLSSNFTYINKPPKFGIINDMIINEDEMVEDYINLKLYVEDLDTAFDDLDFIILNVTDSHVNVRIDNDKNLDIFPYLNWYGEAVVTLKVSDGFDNDIVSFEVTVKPVNDPPGFTEVIENQKLKVGETFSYQPKISDIDNDTLTFSDDTKLFNINKDTGKIMYTAKASDMGTHKISVFVSDGNTSSKMTFEIEVVQESSLLDIYWFPIGVIIVTIIIIIIIKVYSVSHPDKKDEKQKDKRDQKSAVSGKYKRIKKNTNNVKTKKR